MTMKPDGNPLNILRVLAAASPASLTNGGILANKEWRLSRSVNVAAHTNDLLHRGLVDRSIDEDDPRIWWYWITPAGRAALAANEATGVELSPPAPTAPAAAAPTMPTPSANTPSAPAPPVRVWAPRQPKQRRPKLPAQSICPAPDGFRVGIFNDGGICIRAAGGTLDLSADEAAALARACALHFPPIAA